ncbi:sensor histidine kinase [Cellvibrio polysaccharolyticus]|uniref:sensor histidine kinase n=1 Tax=Cellvibrio polysaccharolyticus TaxID=2082724 RepID=UPI001882AAFA|nr:histidine kinase [Cellvibrio polysaccharolyticus]
MTPKPASPGDHRIRRHFLPDLCQSQPVFLLVLVAELVALLLSITATGLQHFSWDVLAITSFYVQWIVLVCAMLLCRLRNWLAGFSLTASACFCYGLVLLATVLLSLLGQWFMHWLARMATGGAVGALFPVIDYWQLGENLLIAAILSGIVLRYFYLQQQLNDQQQGALEARIQALQSRIRPHFLFNSMNSIASLIATDPERAERVVEDLSELYRASLAEPALTALSRELDLCRHYLDIEQLRLGSRLRVNWQIEVDPATTGIPGLLLQPLLENAIFHGIEPLPDGGEIRVRITRKARQIQLALTNPVAIRPGNLRDNTRHNRMAVANIHHRLQAHYGDQARMSTVIDHDSYTTLISWPDTPPPL